MRSRTFTTKPLSQRDWQALNYSQGMVVGFDLLKYQSSNVALIGGGGIGSNAALGLVRKGIGCLDVFDDDEVEVKNLTRQLFHVRDRGKNKALRLAKRLSNEGFFKSRITAYPCRFQEALETGHDFSHYQVLICGVDNNPTRVDVSEYGLEYHIPVIHAAVSRDGNRLYCAVQIPGEACFGCMMSYYVNDNSYPCNLPGIIDVLQVVAGLIVYAVDTILCGRNREWNMKTVCLDGSMPDSSLFVERKKDCALCGQTQE